MPKYEWVAHLCSYDTVVGYVGGGGGGVSLNTDLAVQSF